MKTRTLYYCYSPFLLVGRDSRESFRTICPYPFPSGYRGIAYGWSDTKTVDSLRKPQLLRSRSSNLQVVGAITLTYLYLYSII